MAPSAPQCASIMRHRGEVDESLSGCPCRMQFRRMLFGPALGLEDVPLLASGSAELYVHPHGLLADPRHPCALVPYGDVACVDWEIKRKLSTSWAFFWVPGEPGAGPHLLGWEVRWAGRLGVAGPVCSFCSFFSVHALLYTDVMLPGHAHIMHAWRTDRQLLLLLGTCAWIVTVCKVGPPKVAS